MRKISSFRKAKKRFNQGFELWFYFECECEDCEESEKPCMTCISIDLGDSTKDIFKGTQYYLP